MSTFQEINYIILPPPEVIVLFLYSWHKQHYIRNIAKYKILSVRSLFTKTMRIMNLNNKNENNLIENNENKEICG